MRRFEFLGTLAAVVAAAPLAVAGAARADAPMRLVRGKPMRLVRGTSGTFKNYPDALDTVAGANLERQDLSATIALADSIPRRPIAVWRESAARAARSAVPVFHAAETIQR